MVIIIFFLEGNFSSIRTIYLQLSFAIRSMMICTLSCFILVTLLDFPVLCLSKGWHQTITFPILIAFAEILIEWADYIDWQGAGR